MITDYNNLPLNKYYKIRDILNEEWDIDQQIKILSIITDIPENELLNMKISRYEQQLSALDFLQKPLVPKKNIPRKLFINGKRYVILKNVDKMTAGQYIDVQTYYKNKLGYEYILSALIVPEGKTYGEGYDVADVINDILEMDIQTAVDVCFFFRKKLLNSIRTTLICLDLLTRKKVPQEKKQELKELRKKIQQKLLTLNGI